MNVILTNTVLSTATDSGGDLNRTWLTLICYDYIILRIDRFVCGCVCLVFERHE